MNEILRGTFDANSGLASQGDESKVFAEFYLRSVNDGLASKEAGRPVNKNVTFVKIIQPGESRHSVYDQPATNQDVARFPRQWQAFQAGQKQEAEGSPLSLLFPDNPAAVDNLRHLGFQTIEQLAGANDTAIQNIGLGGREFQGKARAYLAAADKGKDFHTLAARLEQLELSGKAKDDRIAALEVALAEAQEKPRRGRPPNQAADAA